MSPSWSLIFCNLKNTSNICYLVDMIRPTLQRFAHLSGIARAIVDARNASAVATHMVEHRLDDVRLHAKLGHASCASAPEIMEAPRLRVRQAPIEGGLPHAPSART